MTDQNKTHGVLTDKAAQLIPLLQSFLDRLSSDDRSGLMFEADGDTLRETIVFLRTIKRAPQSPVAPADDWRVGWFWSSSNPEECVRVLAEGDNIGKYEKRDDFIAWCDAAPTVSATVVHQVFHSNGSWEDIDAATLANCEDNGVETRTLYTAPTPPTSAADAFKQAEITERGEFHLTVRFPSCRLASVAAAAIASTDAASAGGES